MGPKKEPIVSIKDKIPIWLKSGDHNRPIADAINPIRIAVLFRFNLLGKKLSKKF